MFVVTRAARVFRSLNAGIGVEFGTPVHVHGSEDVAVACVEAQRAFRAYRVPPPASRAAFLRRIWREIIMLGEDLIAIAAKEFGLTEMRLADERVRTVAQLEQRRAPGCDRPPGKPAHLDPAAR